MFFHPNKVFCSEIDAGVIGSQNWVHSFKNIYENVDGFLLCNGGLFFFNEGFHVHGVFIHHKKDLFSFSQVILDFQDIFALPEFFGVFENFFVEIKYLFELMLFNNFHIIADGIPCNWSILLFMNSMHSVDG